MDGLGVHGIDFLILNESNSKVMLQMGKLPNWNIVKNENKRPLDDKYIMQFIKVCAEQVLILCMRTTSTQKRTFSMSIVNPTHIALHVQGHKDLHKEISMNQHIG